MKLGFIGAGNMAAALIKGALAYGCAKDELFVYDILPEKAAASGATPVSSMAQAVSRSDITFLAVKPDALEAAVLAELAGCAAGKAFVSIVAGKATGRIRAALPGARVLRVMPNTPLMYGQGAVALSAEGDLEPHEITYITAFLASMGTVCTVQEKQMDAVTGLSGSGPAYAFMFIEALADAGVMQGLSREVAYKLAAQTLKGAAEMTLKSGEVPAKLKDAVTSPGGTTAAGIYELEKGGMRAAVMSAVKAAAEKSKELGKTAPNAQ